MAFLTAKTGTLVFAIINIVAVTLFTIGVFIHLALAFLNIDKFDKDAFPGVLIDLFDIARVMNKYIISIVLATLDMVFSSFLLNGVLKKEAEHLKVYFVYGFVKIIFAILVVFYFWPAFYYYRTVAAIVYLFSFSSVLYMIRITYKNIEADKIQFDHKPLVEKC